MIYFNISAWPDKKYFLFSLWLPRKRSRRGFLSKSLKTFIEWPTVATVLYPTHCATHTQPYSLNHYLKKMFNLFKHLEFRSMGNKTFCQFILLIIAQWPSSLRDAVVGNIEDMEIYLVVTSFQILNIFSSQFRMTFCWAIHLWLRRPFLRPYCYLSYRAKGTSLLEFRTLDRYVRRGSVSSINWSYHLCRVT